MEATLGTKYVIHWNQNIDFNHLFFKLKIIIKWNSKIVASILLKYQPVW